MGNLTGIEKGKIAGARTFGDVCARCYKKFEEGHRVTRTYIFDRSGRNPSNLQAQGAFFKPEFDFVHVDCNDPTLVKGPPK